MRNKYALLALICALTIFSGQVLAGPMLQVSEEEFDFGYAPQNSKITHSFWLHNRGDDSLVITRVVPGCGCTKAPLDTDRLAPGDSTRMEIIFSTKRYANRVMKRPRIETNEGPPHKNVTIVANVLPRPDSTYPVIVKPYKLDLSQFGEKIRDRMTFSIQNVSEETVRLTLLDLPVEIAQVDLPEKIKPGESAQGTVTLTEAGIGEDFERSLTFQVNDEQNSRFTVPLKRKIRNPNVISAVSGTQSH